MLSRHGCFGEIGNWNSGGLFIGVYIGGGTIRVSGRAANRKTASVGASYATGFLKHFQENTSLLNSVKLRIHFSHCTFNIEI